MIFFSHEPQYCNALQTHNINTFFLQSNALNKKKNIQFQFKTPEFSPEVRRIQLLYVQENCVGRLLWHAMYSILDSILVQDACCKTSPVAVHKDPFRGPIVANITSLDATGALVLEQLHHCRGPSLKVNCGVAHTDKLILT
jgi:hypothetical protein